MVSYEVRIKPSAVKELEVLPRNHLRRLVSRIRALSDDPRPRGCEKLTGEERFRLRQGDYRILFTVDDLRKTVTVVKIGHRRDVHRG